MTHLGGAYLAGEQHPLHAFPLHVPRPGSGSRQAPPGLQQPQLQLADPLPAHMEGGVTGPGPRPLRILGHKHRDPAQDSASRFGGGGGGGGRGTVCYRRLHLQL